MRYLKYLLAAALLVAASASAFAGGVMYERANPFGIDVDVPAATEEEPDIADTVERVQGILNSEALRPSSEATLTRGAVEGMLRSLEDSYAAYFDAKHFKYFSEQTKGEFYGIGVNISVKDGVPIIVSPMKDTPAAKAGLKAEDRIVSVDGTTKKAWDLDEVVSLVRGPDGTKVKLGIKRKGVDGIRYYTIRRARIDVPNIESELVGKDIGYIRLYSFNEQAGREVRSEIISLRKRGAKGFVLDLRDNPGGLLSASADVTSLFIEDGVVVRVEARNKPQDVYRVSGAIETKAPLVVLVNENSASAAEIVAGALQDHGRAALVGVKSYGKGSVQTIQELPKGAAIKFTIAHYLTPKGRSIDRKGLEPDVKVPMDFKLQMHKSKDKQYQRALVELRKAMR